jgi:hypothetical protein
VQVGAQYWVTTLIPSIINEATIMINLDDRALVRGVSAAG